MRGRLAMGPGLHDPLRQLRSMHTLLDMVETMILEGLQNEEERAKYWRKVYTPPVGAMGKRKTPPPGFDAADEMASFRELL